MMDFLFSQQDNILFFYGASLIVLAAACFAMRRLEGDGIPWSFLALYGLFHGFHEWLEILEPLVGESLLFTVCASLLRLAASLSLFEFGLSGIFRLDGRAPRRWIYIVLLAITALGWLFAGWAGLTNASQFVIALPGGILAAIVLLAASRRLTAFPRFLLMTCGLLMALYAVLNAVDIMLREAPPFVASLDGDKFFRQPVLPRGLLRGALSFGMALTMTLYSQLSAGMDLAIHDFIRRSKYVFWISGLAMLFILTAGWMTTQYLGNRASNDLLSLAGSHAATLESQVQSLLNDAGQDVAAIAESPEVRRSFLTGERDFKSAAVVLDYYTWTKKNELVYLLDVKGKVLASTNRHHPDSIVGKDFSHHNYVGLSLQGFTGSYSAFDMVTTGRSFSASYPVHDRQHNIIGIAVVKVHMDDLEADFVRKPGFSFLVSPEGIIFLASHSKMIRSSLWPLQSEVLQKLATSRQFGAGPFNALLAKEPRDGQTVLFQGKRYLLTRRLINNAELVGWSLVLFSPTDQIVFYRLFGIILAIALSVLTISFFVGMEKSLEYSAAIAVSDNRFRTVFEGAPGAIFIVDKVDNHILSTNPFTTSWLGYTEKELLSMTLDKIRVEECNPAGECRYRKRDGALVYVKEVRKEILFQRSDSMLIIAHDISDRRKAEELLHSLSMSDGLTGIANRRRFDEFLEQEWRRAMRDETPLSLVMCDIDYFKQYNDTYGHLDGDDCLKRVVEAISSKLRRPGDLCARYGGEEFALIISGTAVQSALSLAESVRAAVESLRIPHGSSSVSSVVTLSLGVAAITPQKGASSDELIAAADQALYQAKSEGRNRVRHSG